MIEKYIKAPEVLLPKLAALLQPDVALLPRGGPQGVDATLGVDAALPSGQRG
ncbi:MAG TPA: hypothetical protein VK514_00485 [Candidatus Acidoferrum sp.]|nr:hypothetical protein [Candidatus Acidoferrum sp.]